MIISSGTSTSPSSFNDKSSFTSSEKFTFPFGSSTASKLEIISITACGAANTCEIFWNRKLLMNPLRTTSTERIFLGIVNTFSASSSINSPFSSSPITGKKFNNSLICSLRVSKSPLPADVSADKSFANSSKMVNVLAGSKSNT